MLESKIKELERELERSRLEQENLTLELEVAYQELFEFCPDTYNKVLTQKKKNVIH